MEALNCIQERSIFENNWKKEIENQFFFFFNRCETILIIFITEQILRVIDKFIRWHLYCILQFLLNDNVS